jgi:hypothetical protein
MTDNDKAEDKGALSRREDPAQDDTGNRIALGLGFFVVLVLLIGTWIVIGQMRCNPLFSDAGLAHSRDCR